MVCRVFQFRASHQVNLSLEMICHVEFLNGKRKKKSRLRIFFSLTSAIGRATLNLMSVRVFLVAAEWARTSTQRACTASRPVSAFRPLPNRASTPISRFALICRFGDGACVSTLCLPRHLARRRPYLEWRVCGEASLAPESQSE